MSGNTASRSRQVALRQITQVTLKSLSVTCANGAQIQFLVSAEKLTVQYNLFLKRYHGAVLQGPPDTIKASCVAVSFVKII